MRKLFLIAATAVMAATACQKAQTPGLGSGDEVQVTISTSLPGQMPDTRAAGDGTSVDRCIMEIYLDGVLYGERQTVPVSNLEATFSTRLVAGQTYDLVFWADKAAADGTSDLHYNTSDLSNVTIADISGYLGNDDTRDAFYGTAQIVADGAKSIDVDLYRPFGQLNVKTLDMAEVASAAAGLVPTKVKVSFAEVPTGINLKTGELTGAASAVAYADAVALANNEANAGELTIDYIFAPKTEGEQRLVNFTMSFLDDAGNEVATAYDFSNIPVQRNYRTMVSGYLLTRKADVNVAVIPGFDNTINHVITEVSSIRDLNLFLNQGGNAKLMTDLTISNMSMIMPYNKDVDLDLNGHTLTFAKEDGKTCGYKIYGDTSIRNGKIVAQMDSDLDAALLCGSGYTLTLEDVEFDSKASCVGTYSNSSNATIIIKNSTLKCGTYAVSTIASAPVGKNINITIEGSTLEASTPILVNVPSNLTIDNCTINAKMQAMILRGGTANLSNSTLTLDTDNSFTSQEEAEDFAHEFDSSDWRTGNQVNMAAITAGNKGDSYQYPTVLNMENTTVQSVGAYSSLFPAMYVWANQGEDLGVTITYDDQCVFNGDVIYGSSNITVNGIEQ